MATRRSRGDGGLYQRHDHPTCPPAADGGRPDHKCRGRWVGTIEVREGLKKRRKYVYGRTQKEARQKLARALREKDEGNLVIASTTVGAWVNHWLDDIASRDLKPQTVRGYRTKIKCHIEPHLGKIRLTSLTPEHVRGLYDLMREEELAEASIRQTHAILRRALKIAVYEGKLASNPVEKVSPPKTDTGEREQFTPAQARQVLITAGDSLRWWLALFYGMRQGEVLGLRWCDIDLEREAMRIQQTLQRGEDGALFLGQPKSRAGRRLVPLLPQIAARARVAHIEAGEPDWSSDGLIFTNAAGRPIQPRADWQEWRDLLDRATVPPLAPLPYVALHAARNSAASLMEAADVPDRLVAQILGHAQVQITHGYQSAELERMRQAMTGVANLLALE